MQSINLPSIAQTLQAPAARAPLELAPIAQTPSNQVAASPSVSGSHAMLTRLLTPPRGQPAVDEEFQRLIDHALTAARRLPFPRKDSSVDPSRYLPEGICPLPPVVAEHPPDWFEPPFVVAGRNEFEKHAKIAASGEALV